MSSKVSLRGKPVSVSGIMQGEFVFETRKLQCEDEETYNKVMDAIDFEFNRDEEMVKESIFMMRGTDCFYTFVEYFDDSRQKSIYKKCIIEFNANEHGYVFPWVYGEADCNETEFNMMHQVNRGWQEYKAENR